MGYHSELDLLVPPAAPTGELLPVASFPQARRIDLWLAGAIASSADGRLQLQPTRGRSKRGGAKHYWIVRNRRDGSYDRLLHKLSAHSEAAAIGQANAWLATQRLKWHARQAHAQMLASQAGLDSREETTVGR
jgi:hypothetical protein